MVAQIDLSVSAVRTRHSIPDSRGTRFLLPSTTPPSAITVDVPTLAEAHAPLPEPASKPQRLMLWNIRSGRVANPRWMNAPAPDYAPARPMTAPSGSRN
jgi:hypothetical protein